MSPQAATDFKVSIIGCGSVGATAAYALMLDAVASELVIFDIKKEHSEGIALDLEHSLAFLPYTKIVATDDYADCANSSLVVVTAGARQKEGETRLDLIRKNKAIFDDIIPKIARVAPDAILLIVSNPIDILTLEASRLSKFPRNRVFGTGTFLDTARLQFHLSEALSLSPHSVEAFVLGEHGDASFPVWSCADIAGKSLASYKGFNQKIADECYEKTRTAAYRIIHDVGFTCYSIATVIREVTRHIVHNSRVVVPLSVVLQGEYGYKDVALSVPCILGRDGIIEVVEMQLNEAERAQLEKAVTILKGTH